ncbi:hypothetical protein Droror1_Dr00007404 [Drosera rotundifolia]
MVLTMGKEEVLPGGVSVVLIVAIGEEGEGAKKKMKDLCLLANEAPGFVPLQTSSRWICLGRKQTPDGLPGNMTWRAKALRSVLVLQLLSRDV